MWSKIKYYLQLWDGTWSIPLSFFLFIKFQVFMEWCLSDADHSSGIGFYDPAFWQAPIMAAGMVLIFNMVAWLGIWFNFRGVFRYYLEQSKADFQCLSGSQKIAFVVFLYCFYFLVLTVLTLALI